MTTVWLRMSLGHLASGSTSVAGYGRSFYTTPKRPNGSPGPTEGRQAAMTMKGTLSDIPPLTHPRQIRLLGVSIDQNLVDRIQGQFRVVSLDALAP
jgi:hypothetical protein